MAYKGTTAAELWERYDGDGGNLRAQMDIMVAAEMQDRISDATMDKKGKVKGGGNAANARRKQRQVKREELSNTDLLGLLKATVPVVNEGESSD